ncbi:hypothetical protein PVAP13_5NG223881 [Panicum virgatum]|uniref:Uncharacterized protein n=1 Tax=Panicum virgatum TaxID=38727 RepID=A0A8T0RTH1_PANVG|nr:hypothetical protein PVAP13_5NG223881 [Panicum virgatum]
MDELYCCSVDALNEKPSCGRGASSDETTCTRTFVLSTVAIQEEDRRRGSKQGSSDSRRQSRCCVAAIASPSAPRRGRHTNGRPRSSASGRPPRAGLFLTRPGGPSRFRLLGWRGAMVRPPGSGSASQASWRYRSGRTGRKKRLAARRWASGGCRRAAEMVPRRRREIVEQAANPGPAVFSISLVRPDGFGSGSASGPARGRGRA